MPRTSWETSVRTLQGEFGFILLRFSSLSNMKPAPNINMLRCAKGRLDDYLNVQREQTLPTSSASAQVTVHDPYTIPCTTTSSVPVHFQPPHHPPHPRQQNIVSNAITALTSNAATQAGEIEEGQESEVEESMGPPMPSCFLGSTRLD